MNEHERLEDLIPAYALGALDPAERAEVESRLAADPEAQRLLVEYEQIAAQLAFAVPARPAPAHLTDDLRRRLADRRAEARPPRQGTIPARYLLPLAALLVLAVGVIMILSQPPPAAGPAQVFATLQAQGQARRFAVVPGEGQEGVTGELVAAPDGTRAVIQVWQLPAIPPDQTFQLWLRGVDGTVRSGGLFRASPEPMTYIEIPLAGQRVEAFAAFGVSLEPAGGSPYADRPTGPRIFLVPLDQEA